jgi:hypothetical protein
LVLLRFCLRFPHYTYLDLVRKSKMEAK